MIMTVLEVAVLFAEWAIAAVCAALAVAWVVKELLMGVCKIEKRIGGKVVIITGGNTGIGYETALDLAERGAEIIIASRNKTTCEAAKNDIIRATGNSNIHAFALDLASQADVKRFAREVLQQFPQIHFLVNNAGTHGDIHCASPRRRDTADGYETIMATNYLGHFTLTYLLGS